MLLSIIIPVYNVEKYIHECLRSLITQDLTDVEIILVDDGSLDNCPAICDEYATNYPNVRVIHKANGGLISARKSGVCSATGKYVTFVDSDDWVEKDSVAKIKEILDEHSPDVIAFTKHFRAEETKETVIWKESDRKGMFTREALEKIFPSILSTSPFFTFGLTPSVCLKVMKRELIEETIADEPETIRMGEDLAVTIPCVLKANSVYFCDACMYYYRQNPSSITHTFDRTAPQRVNELLEYLARKTQGYEAYNVKEQLEQYAVFITRVTLNSLIKGSQNIRSDLKGMKILWENPYVKQGLKKAIPIRTKLPIIFAKTKQVWALKLYKKRWTRLEKSVKES